MPEQIEKDRRNLVGISLVSCISKTIVGEDMNVKTNDKDLRGNLLASPTLWSLFSRDKNGVLRRVERVVITNQFDRTI